MIYLKWWKGKTYNKEYSTQQGSCSDSTEKSKVYRQAKAKRIQHLQTSCKTNVKGTSLGRKEKATTKNEKSMNGKGKHTVKVGNHPHKHDIKTSNHEKRRVQM